MYDVCLLVVTDFKFLLFSRIMQKNAKLICYPFYDQLLHFEQNCTMETAGGANFKINTTCQ